MGKTKVQTFTSSPKSFVFLAVILLAIFLPPLINGYRSKSWPSVKGEITESKIKYRDKGKKIIVSYSYEVEGHSFTGKKFSYNRQINVGSYKKIHKLLEPYKKGNRVNIFYNPSKPHKSVLVVGYSIIDLVISSIGTIMLIIGISIYLKTRSLNTGIQMKRSARTL